VVLIVHMTAFVIVSVKVIFSPWMSASLRNFYVIFYKIRRTFYVLTEESMCGTCIA